jgi:hypothetical protein
MKEWTKVSEIIENLSEFGDYGYLEPLDNPDDWREMLKEKLAHDQVPELIRRIQAEGFNVPIRLEKRGPRDWYLGNGHHRLSVAILLGMDEILTTSEFSYAYDNYLYSKDSVSDSKGARMLADMVDTAIDWENWPNRTF